MVGNEDKVCVYMNVTDRSVNTYDPCHGAIATHLVCIKVNM